VFRSSQERLAEYPGTVLLISPDRDFLDRSIILLHRLWKDGKDTTLGHAASTFEIFHVDRGEAI
jgi:ATPase subunit of ABC transporter with duplicated ATPase domains